MRERNEGPETAPPLKIRAKSGEIIDLSDVRKDAEIMAGYGIGNPYSVDMAIMVKHVTALLDALEAALRTRNTESLVVFTTWDNGYEKGFADALTVVRKTAGVIEE